MKCLNNDVVTCCYREGKELNDSITRLSSLFRTSPGLLAPFRNVTSEIENQFREAGFQVFPTVQKTTLFYDPGSDCFFKVLHPITLKSRVRFSLGRHAMAIYQRAEYLRAKGIPVQRVEAYGAVTAGNRPFFAVKRAEGDSLYEIFIRRKQTLPMDHCRTVLNGLSKVHSLGFWLGDAHLSHIFVKDGKVSGIIDIDSIRQNWPFMIKNPAKDLAGLNHPDLPLSRDDKYELLNYYLTLSSIRKKDKFVRLLKFYTERRWKE